MVRLSQSVPVLPVFLLSLFPSRALAGVGLTRAVFLQKKIPFFSSERDFLVDPVPGTSLSCFSRAPPKVPGGLRGVFWDAGAQMASEPLSPGLVAAAAAHLLPFVLPKIAIPEGCQEPALPSLSSLDLGFWIKFSNPTVGFVPPGGVPKAPQPLMVLLMGSPLSFPK